MAISNLSQLKSMKMEYYYLHRSKILVVNIKKFNLGGGQSQ